MLSQSLKRLVQCSSCKNEQWSSKQASYIQCNSCFTWIDTRIKFSEPLASVNEAFDVLAQLIEEQYTNS